MRSVALAGAIGRYSTGVPEPGGAPPKGGQGAGPEGGGGRRSLPRSAARVRTVDLDWRSVVVLMAAVVVLTAVTGLIRSAPHALAWMAIAVLLTLALNPLVSRTEQRVGGRRGVAVALVIAGFISAVAVIALLLVPPAIRQARDLSDELPRVVADLGNLPLVGDRLVRADAPAKVQRWVEDLPRRLAGHDTPVIDIGRQVVGGVLAGTATILFTVALLLDGGRLLVAARRTVPPHHRPRAERIVRLTYEIVGRYFARSVLVAGVAGLAVLVVGLLLGVPLTPLAAVWVSMTNLIPQIGGAAGGIPFVLLGVTENATVGLVCAVFFLVYLQFENHVLQPLIVGEAVDLSPPATMAAALIGVSAAGVVGALLAVPTLSAAKAAYLELRRRE